jgi:hypothetical protein
MRQAEVQYGGQSNMKTVQRRRSMNSVGCQHAHHLLLALCGGRSVYFRHLDQRNNNFGDVKFLSQNNE